MADTWIKMRKKLATDPRMIVAARKCDVPLTQMIGGVFILWCMADDHGGNLYAFDANTLDDFVRIEGFTNALPTDWLQVSDHGLTLPDYDNHNGSTAKRRATEAKRVAASRKVSALNANKKRTPSVTREEKRREETTTTSGNKLPMAYPDDFEEFWSHYPRKKHKGAALKAWKKLGKPERTAAIDRAEWFAGCWAHHDPDGKRATFIPHPASWLNANGWEDDKEAVELDARGY